MNFFRGKNKSQRKLSFGSLEGVELKESSRHNDFQITSSVHSLQKGQTKIYIILSAMIVLASSQTWSVPYLIIVRTNIMMKIAYDNSTHESSQLCVPWYIMLCLWKKIGSMTIFVRKRSRNGTWSSHVSTSFVFPVETTSDVAWSMGYGPKCQLIFFLKMPMDYSWSAFRKCQLSFLENANCIFLSCILVFSLFDKAQFHCEIVVKSLSIMKNHPKSLSESTPPFFNLNPRVSKQGTPSFQWLRTAWFPMKIKH